MFRLLRYFAFSSFIFVSIATLLLALFSQHILNQTLLEQGQEQNQSFATAFDQQIKALALDLLEAPSPEFRAQAQQRFDQLLRGLLPARALVRLELFTEDGASLYTSAVSEPAGTVAPELDLSSGLLQSELRAVAVADLLSEQVITWIPLQLQGRKQGALLSLSTDVSSLHHRIERNRYILGAASALVMLLLYGALYSVVRYADGELNKHHAALQSALTDLKRGKQQLELRVIERTQILNSEVQERRQAEQSLRDKEAYLQAVMANTFNAIVCIDKRGRILSFNPTAERMFGYRQQQVVGKNVSLLMPAEHAARHDDYIGNFLRTGEAAIIGSLRALRGLRQDGSEFPMELAITETRVADEPIFIGTIRDISEQQLAEQTLFDTRQQYYHQEKMAAIGFLSAGLVHEIGNPISAISGLLAGICDPGTEHLPCNAKANQQLRMVQEQVDRIINITRDVSEFATPQARGPELQDLNNLIGRTCRLMRHDRRFAEVDLRLALDNQIPAIYGVGDHLIQVLMNLLVNAVDAVTDSLVSQPLILVSSGVEADRVWFEVSDNGCGMSAEVLTHASDAFFTTKPVGRGTGLGLSLCQSLLSEQGATMTLSSSTNLGTQVRVSLRTAPAAPGDD